MILIKSCEIINFQKDDFDNIMKTRGVEEDNKLVKLKV